jgi:hypothetical protein
MDTKSQNGKLLQSLIAYTLLGLSECVGGFLLLLRISTDPKNVWFLGLSKSRWLMVMGVGLLGVIFSFLFFIFILKWKKNKFEGIITKFKSFHINTTLVRVVGFSFLFILLGLFSFHHFLNIQVPSIVTRLTPLFVLGELITFQTIIFLVISHSLFTGQPFSKGFIDIFFFPSLQRIIFIIPGRTLNRFFQIIENHIDRLASKFNRKVLIGIILLSPILITITLVWLSFNTTLSAYLPTGSDEMVYWREMLTFSTVGFEGGQYSTDELAADVELTRFDAHGPAFPVFYGIIGRIVGWQLISGLVLNHLFLTLALCGFIYLSRPNNQQLLMLWLLLVTFWPIWLYMPTTRVEGLFFAIAIALAALFSRLITPGKKNVVISILLVLMIFFAGSMRISWSLMFITLIGVLIGSYSWKGLIKSFLLAAVPMGIAILYFKLFVSPYPSITYNLIHSLGSGELNQFIPFVKTAIVNTRNFFSTFDTPIYVLLRYQMLWVLIVSVVDFYNVFKQRQQSTSIQSKNISFLNSSNLGIIFIFNIAFATVHAGREYRLWAPHLLLSLLILLFSSRQRLVLGMIISNLIFSVSFGNTFYAERYPNFLRDTSDIVEIQNAISEHIVYQPVGNRWCNTIDISRYSNEATWGPWMLTLPEEFGVTSIFNWNEFYRKNLRAKYVLLDPEYIQEHYPYLFGNTNLEPLTETPIGTLYFNHDSDCPLVE